MPVLDLELSAAAWAARQSWGSGDADLQGFFKSPFFEWFS